MEKIKKSKELKGIFYEFKSDTEKEKKNLLETKGTELKNVMFAGEMNSYDYFMTNSNPRDYKKLQIRSMELFQKFDEILR